MLPYRRKGKIYSPETSTPNWGSSLNILRARKAGLDSQQASCYLEVIGP